MMKWIIRLGLLALVVGGGYAAYRGLQQLPQRQSQIATTEVRRGDVVVRSFARGEIRAVRSTTLTAPNLFGTVQVTRLAPLGALAREKDLIVEFDDSEVNSRLEEKQLELEQVDEQIKKAQADLAMRNNQDQVDLLQARYAVRRAELEVRRNELLAAIDRRRNELNLEEARKRLAKLEVDIKSRLEQAQAELAVLRERKNKANLEMSRERQRLTQVKLLAPMGGLVAIRQNRNTNFFFGQALPDIREGDQLQPGSPVADVLDLSELEVVAKVGELDRANLREGQDVLIRLDAVAEKVFHGRIKNMSGTATANVFSSDPGKKFDVLFSLDMKELLTGLGAKPEQVQRILAQAEVNRKRGPVGIPSAPMAMAMAGGPGGAPAGGAPAGGANVMAASTPAGGSGGGPGGGGGARMVMRMGGGAEGAAGLTPEQQKKIQEAQKKAAGGKDPKDMTPEERQAYREKMREAMAGIMGGGRPGGGGGRPGGPGGPSMAELENAKLPNVPEGESQLDVLLRPGLLADVEIIVEKVTNAVHLPAQAVFEKDGKPVVYLIRDGRQEARPIQIAKRSESTVVIASGVKPGDEVALANPDAKPGDKKKADPSGGSPMGGMPAGGGRGGR